MRLIDADALRADHGMSDDCRGCNQDPKACQYDTIYSKMDFCEWLDEAPTIEPEQRWIPCSERLPEEDGEYLVLYYIRSKYKPYVYDVRSFANDLYQIDEYYFYDKEGQKGWFYCDIEYGYCEDNSVLAWMPLPEPYKEES